MSVHIDGKRSVCVYLFIGARVCVCVRACV